MLLLFFLSNDCAIIIRLVITCISITFIQIQESVSTILGGNTPGAVIACFLVQEGADISLQNLKGHTPLQLSPPHIISLVMSYGGRYVCLCQYALVIMEYFKGFVAVYKG